MSAGAPSAGVRECGPPRVFLVGTDTDCGKTTLACALLRAGRRAGLRVLPFKPAASGPAGPDADPERLVAASDLGVTSAEICPLRFAAPLAPGIAEDPGAFTGGGVIVECESKGMSEKTLPLEHVRKAMEEIEARVRPDVTLIEGAGGLWVPMPGGTWLPQWIGALAATPVVVGRLGLGGINHALLTILGLRRLGAPPRGFFLVDTTAAVDPSRADNAAIVARASGLPCLGVLPHGAEPDDWLDPGVWERMMDGTGPFEPVHPYR